MQRSIIGVVTGRNGSLDALTSEQFAISKQKCLVKTFKMHSHCESQDSIDPCTFDALNETLPEAKRHKPSLLSTSFTVLWLLSLDNFSFDHYRTFQDLTKVSFNHKKTVFLVKH